MHDVNCIIVTTTTIQFVFSGHELYWVIIFIPLVWCAWCELFCCDYYYYHNTTHTHILLTWVVWRDSAILHNVGMRHFISMRKCFYSGIVLFVRNLLQLMLLSQWKLLSANMLYSNTPNTLISHTKITGLEDSKWVSLWLVAICFTLYSRQISLLI